jgi:acetyl esterase/lipase
MKKVFVCLSVIILALLFVIIVGIIVFETSIIHVQLPHGAVLHVLPAPKDNQAHGAVILCPGGGYGHQSKWYEGYWWFPFYHYQGFTVAMLEYRLPNYDHQVPMIDGAEAIQLMRTRAKEWNYDIDNVGIMGFSAGGHLASTLMVSDKVSIRPDFGILFYPVISMKKELTHMRTHNNLLGGNASEELEYRYSNELHVSGQTPPAYIALSSDDPEVKPQNSIRFQEEMRVKNRPVVLHVYPSGGHGWGYRLSFPHHRQMLDDLSDWLKSLKK